MEVPVPNQPPPPVPALPAGRNNKKPRAKKGTKKTGTYLYNERNEGLDLYGVMVVWDQKDLSNKQLEKKFSSVLAARKAQINPVEEQPAQEPTSSEKPPKDKRGKTIKRKPMPFFRRIGPTKGIIAFETWQEANDFNKTPHLQFKTFIPMSFVTTVGVAEFDTRTGGAIKTADLYPYSSGYEVIHARKKVRGDGITLVTVAIRGYELPKYIYAKDRFAPLALNPREPAICLKCLRFGHRKSNCFRKARCGACMDSKPKLRHVEKNCHKIRANRKSMNCIHCCECHHTALQKEGCGELTVQTEYKNKLNKHHLDFVNTLESEIIPQIRTTAINSNRGWLD